MNERSITVHTAIACVLWPAGFILVCVGVVTEFELGQPGIVLCMIAATLTVRGYFCTLHDRELNAFTLGRDAERGMADVKRLR